MRTADMVKSKFFGARDLQGQRPLVLTIAHVTEELLGRGTQQEMQCFLWFTDHQKGLKLNKTRVTVLETAYGPDSDLWTGQRVRLTFDPTVKFGNVPVGSIKVETPPGAVYQATAVAAGWGQLAAGTPAVPSGAPPAPVWDAERRVWVTQAPISAPASSAAVPPPPVWDAVTGQWEVVNPSTGEIGGAASRVASPGRPAAPANSRDVTWGGAPTISQRMAAPPAADPWAERGPAMSGADTEFGDPDIPF